jgi:putative PIN family toxin of toxin-antitoxin system
MPVRAVLDTNVVISALLWKGTPYRLLDTLRRQANTQIVTSAVLLEELAEVLTRPMAAKRLALIGRTAHQILTDYVDAVDLVSPVATPSVVPADADDDHVIAAAVAAEADFIVSGDRHLLDLVHHGHIRIVTPADALRLIGGTD